MIFIFYRPPFCCKLLWALGEKLFTAAVAWRSHIVCIPKIFLVDAEIDVCGDHDILYFARGFSFVLGHTTTCDRSQWKPNMRWDDGSPKLFLPLAFLPAPNRKTGDELKSNNCSKKIHRLRLGDRHRLTHRATYTQSFLWGIYPPFFLLFISVVPFGYPLNIRRNFNVCTSKGEKIFDEIKVWRWKESLAHVLYRNVYRSCIYYHISANHLPIIVHIVPRIFKRKRFFWWPFGFWWQPNVVANSNLFLNSIDQR